MRVAHRIRIDLIQGTIFSEKSVYLVKFYFSSQFTMFYECLDIFTGKEKKYLLGK